MADDPNRDILPVKEASCADTIFSTIDPRERHLVCKLDRYQLEDKYLRLLDEANDLKKLSNCQEDKIKRLGTKLIRLAGNPRSCGLALNIADDRNRTSALELENTKLKEKIAVMRNQLLSHTMNGRSSSRSRNLTRPTSSGLVTCRSENNHARTPSCQCVIEPRHDDSDMQTYLVKIEKLEAQKKDMAYRIADLEKELALYTTSSQREKVAGNVEYIRVWRQMKQLNDKLITTQEKNVALTAEINDLKTTLEQTTKNNQKITAVLTSERTRMAEIDDQILKAKNSQLTLREKDEQIRDLMSEMKILQQHNNELIVLTSKYSQIELENIELKKRLSEHAHEQQNLKTAFNNEQTNIVALQVTNEQLLAKLQELQANIDTLTIQLASFHKQDEKCDTVMKTSSPIDIVKEKENNTSNFKRSSTFVEQCKKCCEMYDKVTQLEKIVDNSREDWQPTDKSVQTITIVASTKEQGTMTLVENNEKVGSRLQSSLNEWKTNQERRMETNGTNVLSREKILKLLDQAQINAPLDASRIAQKGIYTNILDVAQRHSDGSSQTSKDESNNIQKNLICRRKFGEVKSLENPNMTADRILLILFDILQEHLLLNNADEEVSMSQVSTNDDPLIDVNNNNLAINTTNDIKENNINIKTRNSGNENYVTAIISDNNHITSTDIYNHKDDCTCDHVKTCRINAESNCCTDCVSQSIAICMRDNTNSTCEDEYTSTNDIGSSKGTIDTTCFSRIYEKYRRSSYYDISNDFYTEKITKKPKMPPRRPKCDSTCHLQKVKNLSKQEKQKLPCKIKCSKDSLKLPLCRTESLPLLITNRQGLVEIHILQLQLSTSVAKIPEKEDIRNLRVYISWDIWDEKTACTPRMKCPNLNFDSSSVYRITDLFSFFKNVLLEYLVFRVNIIRQNGTSYMLARAKVSIKDILDYPQNKLHYIIPVNCIISCLCGVNLGQLSLWVRLSCNVDIVETFKKQCGISLLPDTFHMSKVQKSGNDVSVRTVGLPSSDTVAFKDRDSTDSPISEVSNNQHGQSSIDSSNCNHINNSVIVRDLIKRHK